mgnify:CR=1 FL=1
MANYSGKSFSVLGQEESRCHNGTIIFMKSSLIFLFFKRVSYCQSCDIACIFIKRFNDLKNGFDPVMYVDACAIIVVAELLE